MKKFQQQRKTKKIIYSSGMIIILILIALFFFNSTWDVYLKAKETTQKRTEAKKEFDELKNQETYLREQIERLSTERGIEEEVRTKFSVVKDGESVVVIVNEEEDVTKVENSEEKLWWRTVLFWK